MKITHYSQYANAPFLAAFKTTKAECGRRVSPKLVTASYAGIECEHCKRLVDDELAKLDAACKLYGSEGWVRIRTTRRQALGLGE